MSDMSLAQESCQPRSGAGDRLDGAPAEALLQQLPGWAISADGKALEKDFRFPDFHHTLGFIAAVGWMANTQDHHPDLEAGYGHCRLRWSTHDVDGLSRNDFICAARSESLAAGRA